MNALSALTASIPTPTTASGAPPPIARDAITVITPSQRVVTPCSSVVGLLREACIDQDDVWMGMVSAEPGTASVWHDHGERTTYVLPIAGEGCYIEYGDGERVYLKADGSLYVTPAHLRHREVNPGSTRMQAFLIRLGPKAQGVTE